MPGLGRFVEAQQAVYDNALAELRAGSKRGHWIWFVFPQIAGLGRTSTAQLYAIADMAEAEAYLRHPLLAPRLMECAAALLPWAGRKSAEAILGPVDALKLRSSMTLFEAAGGDPVFAQVIDAFYRGERDQRTLDLL
ncbi:DUF1810 domain-containing protein [Tsuneonella sp. HG222]